MKRSMAAAAVVHGRFNAGAVDHVLLDGRWRKVQLVKATGSGTDTRILLEVGTHAQREQRTLWPADVLVIRRDPRRP